MTAWLTKEQLEEEFSAYLRETYGDSAGDFSIGDQYVNVVDIVAQMLDWEDQFDDWKQGLHDRGELYEHPSQERWTRDPDLADYADNHPDDEDVTDWDSVNDAPSGGDFNEGDYVYVIKEGHAWYGRNLQINSTDVGASDGEYELEGVDDFMWFQADEVSATAPVPQPTGTAPAPVPPAPATGQYPTPQDRPPLDPTRMQFKVGDKVACAETNPDYPDVLAGQVGKVVDVDLGDSHLPYKVEYEKYNFGLWVPTTSIGPVDPAAATKSALERIARTLQQRNAGMNDAEWKELVSNLKAGSNADVTDDMVDEIAEAIRPPASRNRPITL